MSARLALVTGASSGIGAALARVYASHGYDLALTARRGDRLHALADEVRLRYGVDSLVIPADLSLVEAPEQILAAVEANGREVDALVNNAGYGLPGSYAATRWEDQRALLQVLVTSPCELAHKVLPGMIERRFGRIVNVASLAGLAPGAPGHTLYGPAKALIVRFSQALHLETQGTGVQVSALCPGFTYSEFHDVAGTRAQVSDFDPHLALARRRRGGPGRLRGGRSQPPDLRHRRAQQGDRRAGQADPRRMGHGPDVESGQPVSADVAAPRAALTSHTASPPTAAAGLRSSWRCRS